MDADRTDALMQYALAAAGRADEWRDRQLGPVHLVKYVYLADLAHAEAEGDTFTGADWRFDHLGPHCEAVAERVELAMPAPAPDEPPARRWSSLEPDADRRRAGAGLPITVRIALDQATKRWGADTQALLHFVYATTPMLNAAPGESLPFERRPPSTKPEGNDAPQTARQKKKASARVEALKARLAALRAAPRPGRPLTARAPRYDAVFSAGLKALDALSGAAPAPQRGLVEIDATVWRSETRRRPNDAP